MKEQKFMRFVLPPKPKGLKQKSTNNVTAIVRQLRDYGRERGLPSKEVVALHKEMFK